MKTTTTTTAKSYQAHRSIDATRTRRHYRATARCFKTMLLVTTSLAIRQDLTSVFRMWRVNYFEEGWVKPKNNINLTPSTRNESSMDIPEASLYETKTGVVRWHPHSTCRSCRLAALKQIDRQKDYRSKSVFVQNPIYLDGCQLATVQHRLPLHPTASPSRSKRSRALAPAPLLQRQASGLETGSAPIGKYSMERKKKNQDG